MATTQPTGTASRLGTHDRLQHDTQTVKRDVTEVKQRAKPLLDFWTKVGNDWVSQMSDMLAFKFLTSLFPLLLVIIAIAGFVLGTFSHTAELQLQTTIASALPADTGRTVVAGVMNNLNRSAGLVLILGILGALWTGSRLFIAIENCSGIVFRLRKRDALHQNIMAILMTLLYVVLVPLVFGAATLSTILLRLVGLHTAVLAQLLGLAVGYLAAVVLFGAIYIVVPNRPVRPGEVWRGALLAGALLVLYELLFPLYASHFLKPSNYGSVAGFAIAILIFFYYLGFILLLGMEINSWAGGQRQTASDIVGIMH
ncbi:MAG: YihY/virulence factor BrkB family protein, partial [Candidatus Saccharimonadales bacterium]